MTNEMRDELIVWPSDDRINNIGQNGNSGEHYAVVDQREQILDLNASNIQLKTVRSKYGYTTGYNN